MAAWRRSDGILAIALYAVAVAARLALLRVHPYGDEAHHYYVAREFGDAPDNLVGAGDLRWLFWWRPLFSLLLSPGAQVSFDGFRVGYILLVGLLAPAAYFLLRGRGAGPLASAGAGTVLALHPFFVVWGVRAFPDELMATFYVLGLAVWQRARWVAAGALFLVAAWVKEVALVGLVVLLAEHLWTTRNGWRVTPTCGALILVVVLALAYLPHLYAESIGGQPPGWSRGGSLVDLLDGAFLTLWLVPAVLLSLLSPRARQPALHALAYLGFFAAYTFVLGGAAEQWYYVLPATLAFLALFAALSDLWTHAGGPTTRSQAHARAVPIAGVLAVLLVQVFAPAASDAKDLLHPDAVASLDFSAQEAWDYEHRRDAGLWQAIDAMTDQDRQAVLLVDLGWFYGVWPFPDVSGSVGAGYTLDNPAPAQDWAHVIEELATATVLLRTDSPMNQAIRATYRDCISHENPDYVVVRGMQCKGRAGLLEAERDERLNAPAAPRPS